MPDLAGTLVGDRYRLERELGRGGMAVVWLARDVRHDRPVAVKVIHPELAGAIGVDRFVREVRLTAQLRHPGTVPILDSGTIATPDGHSLPWYAMPYLEGESLRQRLTREGQLPIEEALRITEAVGAALLAAHRQGIVHRDVKPENIFLSDPHVYVVDFGIAKALIETGAERLTSTGLAIGTPAYMSPEQGMADPVDARSDQYSLATILYEMLAGEPPFSGPTAQAIVSRRLAEPARPIHSVRSTVPEPVERAVLRALERAPADRFPDVGAFTAALREKSRGTSRLARGLRSPRVWAAAGLLALVIGGGRLLLSRIRPPARRAPDSVAVALYATGLRAYDRRTPAGIVEAIAAFGQAIGRDSLYAPAWTGLANSYTRAYLREFAVPGVSRDSVLRLAVAAASRALAVDPESSAAWVAQAIVSDQVDPTDVGPPMRSVRQAIRLDSTNAAAWHYLAIWQAETGDFTAATEAWRRCVRVGPSYTQGVAFLALGHYWQRQYDSAAVWADSAVALDPTYLFGRTTVGSIAVERGEYDRARAAFDAARRVSSGIEVANDLAGSALAEVRAGDVAAGRAVLRSADSLAATYVPASLHTAVYLAQVYAALGQADRALGWLNRYEPRRDRHFQPHLRCDPPFDPIRNNPRFRALLVTPSPPPGRGC